MVAIAVETGLQFYLKQINETPLLDAERERELSGRIRGARLVDDRFSRGECTLTEKEDAENDASLARDEMIRSNLRLVVNLAKNYSNRGMALSDLIEEGNLGLLRAVEGYDPSQNTRFSTYAGWWIKQSIKRALINAVQPVHIPAYMMEMVSKWRQAVAAVEDQLGRQPALAEIAEYMKLPESKVQVIRRAVRAFSAPTQSASADGAFTLSESLPDHRNPQPDEAVLDQADNENLREFLERIDDRERKVLCMRFGLDGHEPMTLKEIGKRIGLTRERIRQIEGQALRKLNQLLADDA